MLCYLYSLFSYLSWSFVQKCMYILVTFFLSLTSMFNFHYLGMYISGDFLRLSYSSVLLFVALMCETKSLDILLEWIPKIFYQLQEVYFSVFLGIWMFAHDFIHGLAWCSQNLKALMFEMLCIEWWEATEEISVIHPIHYWPCFVCSQ